MDCDESAESIVQCVSRLLDDSGELASELLLLLELVPL